MAVRCALCANPIVAFGVCVVPRAEDRLGTFQPGRHSLLLVESQPHAARNLQRILEGAGANVLQAAHASDALIFTEAT
jgi:hypothetical protein